MKRLGVILAGGKGTRFWPLSREKFPKQFIDFFGDSLINMTIKRLEKVLDRRDIYVLTTESLKDLTKQNTGLLEAQVIIEPIGRNTAPAIAFFSYLFLKRYDDAIVGFFPADHMIKNEDIFVDQLNYAFSLAQTTDNIIIFGVPPTGPNVNYGYIQIGKKIESHAWQILRFTEKPNSSLAKEYFESGDFFWNAGMFVFRLSVIRDEFLRNAPEIWQGMDKVYEAFQKQDNELFKSEYERLPDISIDYAIMQKTGNVMLMPAQFDWSDVGTFSSVFELLPKDNADNAGHLPVFSIDSRANLVYSRKPVKVLIDVEDIVLVETSDALLLMKKGSDHKIKDVIQAFRADPELKKFL